MNFSEKLLFLQDRINKRIVRDLPASTCKPARLHEAMNYSMQAGGKRLRPLLVHAAQEVYPGIHDPIAAGIALEIIHTYSLIHDDLPAMDDSDLRRGRPACHKAYDEATAILAGDALIPLAFQYLVESYREAPALALDLVHILAQTAGSEKLVGGQMMDLLAEGTKPDAQTLSYIHENKTAAMIQASLEMGFRLGEMGDDQNKLILIRQAGLRLGLAFQAVDDLLDVTSSTEMLGKDAGQDAGNQKITWVVMLGEKKARKLAEEHTQAAVQAIEKIGGNNGFLLQLIKSMLDRQM